MGKKYLILLLICSMHFVVHGQRQLSTKSKKAAELYYNADNYRVRGQLSMATELFTEAIKKDKGFYEAYYQLATIYKMQGNYTQAEQLFLDAIDIRETPFPGAHFQLAELYLANDNYEKAIERAEKYLSFNSPNPEMNEMANHIMANARYALENQNNALAFNPQPLSDTLNAFVMQYFPVVAVDGSYMIFTRRLGQTSNDDEDLVISYKNDAGQWQKPISISDNINTSNNEGTCTLSADGRTLIFTSCYGRQGYGSCDLFISIRNGDEWSVPENLGPNINSRFWESQPSLSADGRTLYFISNRTGGIGGRDIWVSTRDDNNDWSKPKNMGALVNTVNDEVSPYIHPNNLTLYYATDGLPGFGGFDIYFSQFEDGHWNKPENIGAPINNGKDQVSLFITALGDKGYYSNENANAQKKGVIYSFDLNEFHALSYRTSYIHGVVTDKDTAVPVASSIELYNLSTDSRVAVVSSDAVTGEYLITYNEGADYALYISAKNYLFKSETFSVDSSVALKPVNKNIALEKLQIGATTQLNNIFFDTDSYKLKEKSKTELKKLIDFLKLNPSTEILITGHTDNVGNDTYNLTLSKNRAQVVVDYLIEAGISQLRFSSQGLGSSRPLVPNTSDTNRQMNRRIEFEIIH